MTVSRTRCFWFSDKIDFPPHLMSAYPPPVSKQTLTLGHSPDPDDAFMFYGLAKELIPANGYRFEHVLQDIQTLNERARRGELDITAISIHAYPYVSDQYALL